MINKEKMRQYGAMIGLELVEEKLDQLDEYARFLVEYNEKVNLTTITDPDEIIRKHFADSLQLLAQAPMAQGARLIDVGTGAGFPSLPLKIARPDLQVTLLDSLNKRIVFLQQLCQRLGIQAEAIHARAEEAGRRPQLRERFDFATARAVSHLRELSEYCLPFVKVGGSFLAMKGPEVEQELEEGERAVKLMGGRVGQVIHYELPEIGEGRTLLVISKERPTPKEYPRPSAKIAKKPLD